VTDDNGLCYSHSLQRAGEEIRLGRRSPRDAARTLAVTKPRSVEGDHPAAAGRTRNKTADLHIGNGHAVAMKQYHRGARSAGVDLVQPDAAHPGEVAARGISSLSVERSVPVKRRQSCQNRDRSQTRWCGLTSPGWRQRSFTVLFSTAQPMGDVTDPFVKPPGGLSSCRCGRTRSSNRRSRPA
jgi:hypothetical protein